MLSIKKQVFQIQVCILSFVSISQLHVASLKTMFNINIFFQHTHIKINTFCIK